MSTTKTKDHTTLAARVLPAGNFQRETIDVLIAASAGAEAAHIRAIDRATDHHRATGALCAELEAATEAACERTFATAAALVSTPPANAREALAMLRHIETIEEFLLVDCDGEPGYDVLVRSLITYFSQAVAS